MGPRQVGFLSQLYPMTCTSDYWWPNVRAMSTPSASICLQQLCYCQPLLLQWPSPHGSYSSLFASLSAFPDILFLWTFHHGLAWVSQSRICDSELKVCTNWRAFGYPYTLNYKYLYIYLLHSQTVHLWFHQGTQNNQCMLGNGHPKTVPCTLAKRMKGWGAWRLW